MAFSPDLKVMAAPERAYAAALAASPGAPWTRMRRPFGVALVLGTGSAVSSTGHLTLGLLASGIACWSFVVLIQIATASAVLRSRRGGPVPFTRRLDLWFMGHAPWSLWILAATTVMGSAPFGWRVEWPIILSSLVPIAWTTIIAAAFCRVVLGDSPAGAILRTAIHQALTWGIALAYVAWAVALGPRVAAVFGG